MKKHGFSLLEISIVALIIGLILGTISVASNMVMQAQVRRLAVDLNQYQSPLPRPLFVMAMAMGLY